MYDLLCTNFHETQDVQQNYVQISYTKFLPYWTLGEEIYPLKWSMAFGAPSFTKCILLNIIMWGFSMLNFIQTGQQA